MNDPIFIAQADDPIYLLPKLANRHGLIAGATGTGKTFTLQTPEAALGVPAPEGAKESVFGKVLGTAGSIF